MRRIIRSIAFCALTLMPGFATAAGPSPTDSTFTKAKTVGVLPVLTTGSRGAAYARLSAFIEQGSHKNGVMNPLDFVQAPSGGQGFGFAGASTDADLAIFQYAFLLGSVPTVAEDSAQLQKVVASLEGAREALAPLGADVVAAVSQFLAQAKLGVMDAGALSRALRAAEEGIAKGPARAHGYFAAGAWLGLSMVAVSLSVPDETFNAMAGPLAAMLDEDAAFEGSDKKIAASMRRIAGMLAQGRVDMSSYKGALSELLSVNADVQ